LNGKPSKKEQASVIRGEKAHLRWAWVRREQMGGVVFCGPALASSVWRERRTIAEGERKARNSTPGKKGVDLVG